MMKSRALRQIAAALLITVTAPGMLLAGCGGREAPAAQAGPNVVVLLVDTLRADHLGCYGYSRDTSPVLDRLAGEGVLFEQAFSPSSFTRESVAALFTGKYPSSNPWGSGWLACPDPEAPTLPGLFRQAGYETHGYINNPAIKDQVFLKDFDHARVINEVVSLSGNEHALSKMALEGLDARDQGAPFLLYMHYLDPHAPYEPSDAFYFKFAREKYPDPIPLIPEVRSFVLELQAKGFGPGDPRFEDLVLRYDAEISMVDEAIGVLLDGLKARGLDENTIIVLMSDHGEEFLEHGFVEHCWTVFRESIHVPLIFRWPGKITPGRVAEPVSTVSVFPTLLRLAGMQAPEGLDGEPLWNGSEWRANDKPVFSELLIQSRLMMRVVQHGDYAYLAAPLWLDIATRSAVALAHQEILKEFATGQRKARPIWGPPEREFLFNVSADRMQQQDILADHPEIAEKYRAILEEYRGTCPPNRTEMEQRALTGFGVDSELEAQLKALGYLE